MFAENVCGKYNRIFFQVCFENLSENKLKRESKSETETGK